MIADGSVTLTAVRLLAGSLTDLNHRTLLDSVRHKSKREVEQLVAALHPQPPVQSTVGRCPGPISLALPSSRHRSARPGALQGPDHREPRNARQASTGAGPPAAPAA